MSLNPLRPGHTPTLAEICAFITNNTCVTGDCSHIGKACEGCSAPVCDAHSETTAGKRLCLECSEATCPECGQYIDTPKGRAQHRCGGVA